MIKRINSLSFFLVLTSLLLSVSCKSDIVFSDSFTFPEKIWRLTERPAFEVQVTDTLNANNIWFMFRTGSAYPFRNIYFFVTAVTPDGKPSLIPFSIILRMRKATGTVKELAIFMHLTFPINQMFTFL